MNLSKLLSLLVLAASVANNLQAATHFVVAESSFQAAINAAAPGDTLMVEPGIYTDATVLFNKPLTVIASGGALGGTFNFTGSVRVEAPGALTYFQQAYFIGPVQMVGSPVLAVDSTFNNATGASGGKLTAKRTSFNTTLSITNTPFEGLRATIYQFFALGNIPEKPSLVMAQSSLSANVAQQITGYKVWLGYNASLWNLTLTSCESTLIGNTIRGNGFIVSSGTIKAYNNLLVFGQAVTAMSLNDGVLNAELVNNTLYAASHSYSVGLAARGSLGPINLVGNIFSAEGGQGIFADAASGPLFSIRYCNVFAPNPLPGVATSPVQTIFTNPKLNPNFTLADDSPCRNAGRPEAVYNNRDGTRNTMGHLGGNLFDPANLTTSDPMVFLVTGPQSILRGGVTTIPIRVGAASGH